MCTVFTIYISHRLVLASLKRTFGSETELSTIQSLSNAIRSGTLEATDVLILKRAMYLTLCAFCFVPYAILITYEASTGRFVTSLYDGFATISLQFSNVMHAIVYVFYEVRLRTKTQKEFKAWKKYFFPTKSAKSSIKSSVSAHNSLVAASPNSNLKKHLELRPQQLDATVLLR